MFFSITRRAFLASLLSGFAVGAADALLSWSALGRFAETPARKLVCALDAAALYASFGAVAGAFVGVIAVALWHHTALGGVRVSLAAPREGARASEPELGAFSLAVAIPALAAGALAWAWSFGVHLVSTRHHGGLIAASIIAGALGLCALAVVAAFPAARVIELGLRRLLPQSVARALARPRVVAVAFGSVLIAALSTACALARETLGMLPLRPAFAAADFAILAALVFYAMGRTRRRTPEKKSRAAAVALAAAWVCLVAMAAALGSRESVRKAVVAGTGLGGPLADLLRRGSDFDGDGFGSLLGGGDCDGFDPLVYPGALDIPGDGLDQDCTGADAPSETRRIDPRFVPLPETVPRDLNVLLLTVDALRAANVGAYGYRRGTTPVIDALAREGTLFENFFAHGPSTRYCIPSILTGRHPSQVLWDYRMWWPGLLPGSETIARAMKRAGLATGAVLSYRYFDAKRRMNRGFDSYDNRNAALHEGQDPAATRGSSSKEQSDAAVAFLEKHAAERWFLWTHYYDPHFEYEKHAEVRDFGDEPVDVYDNEVLFTDAQIGRVIEKLKALNLYEKTAIVVTADHGEGFGEHGIQFHGYHLYLPQTKVPCVVRVPGLAPRRIATPAGHVDLLPTLANLVGGAPVPGEMGRSLLGEIEGAADPQEDRAVFQEVVYEGHDRRALATARWHLIYNRIPDNSFELYDLDADPGETVDLWGRAPEGEPLRERLLAWLNEDGLSPEGYAVAARAFPPALPDGALEIREELGGGLLLVGVELPRGAVRRGKAVDMALYLEAVGSPSGAPIVSLRIEGEGERIAAEHEPLGGIVPLALWPAGRIAADTASVAIPKRQAPGNYSVYASVSMSGGQKVAGNGARRVKMGDIRIEK